LNDATKGKLEITFDASVIIQFGTGPETTGEIHTIQFKATPWCSLRAFRNLQSIDINLHGLTFTSERTHYNLILDTEVVASTNVVAVKTHQTISHKQRLSFVASVNPDLKDREGRRNLTTVTAGYRKGFLVQSKHDYATRQVRVSWGMPGSR